MSNHPYNYGYGQYNTNNYYPYENNSNFHQRGGFHSLNFNRGIGNRGRGGWYHPYNHPQNKNNKQNKDKFTDYKSRTDTQTSHRGSSHYFSSNDKQKSLESEPIATSTVDSSIESEKERLKKVEEDKARLSKLLSSSSKLLPVGIDNEPLSLGEVNDQVSEKRESCLRLPTLELTESDYKQIGSIAGRTQEEDEAEIESEGNESNLVIDSTDAKLSEDDANDCELIEKSIETIVLDEVHVSDSDKVNYSETQSLVPLNNSDGIDNKEKLSDNSSACSGVMMETVIENVEVDNPVKELVDQHQETNDNVEELLDTLEMNDSKNPSEEIIEDGSITKNYDNAKLLSELTEGDNTIDTPLETTAEAACDEDFALSENSHKDQISLREETSDFSTEKVTLSENENKITNTSKTYKDAPVPTRALNIIQEREEIIGFINRNRNVGCDSVVSLSRRGKSFSKSQIFNLYKSFLKCRRFGKSSNRNEKTIRNMGNNLQENPFLNRENLINVSKPLFNEQTSNNEEISENVRSDLDHSCKEVMSENKEINKNVTVDIAEQEADEFMDNYGHLLDDNFTIPVEVLQQLGLSDICSELNLDEIVTENETPAEHVQCNDEPQSTFEKNFKEKDLEVITKVPVPPKSSTDNSSTENELTENDCVKKVVSSEKSSEDSDFKKCTHNANDRLQNDSDKLIEKDADNSLTKKEIQQAHNETVSLERNLSVSNETDKMVVDFERNIKNNDVKNASGSDNSNEAYQSELSKEHNLLRKIFDERMLIYLSKKKAPQHIKKIEKSIYESTVKNMSVSDYFQCAIDSALKLQQSKNDINPAAFVLKAVGDTIMKNCNISNESKSCFASAMAHLMNFGSKKNSKMRMKKDMREKFESNLQFISDHFQISHPEVADGNTNLQDATSSNDSYVNVDDSNIEMDLPNIKQSESLMESAQELKSFVCVNIPSEEVNENTSAQVSGIQNFIGLLMEIDKNIRFLTELKISIYKEIQRNNSTVNSSCIERQNKLLNNCCQLLKSKLKSLDVEDKIIKNVDNNDPEHCDQSFHEINENDEQLNKTIISSKLRKRNTTQKFSSKTNESVNSVLPSKQKNYDSKGFIQCEKDDELSDIGVEEQINKNIMPSKIRKRNVARKLSSVMINDNVSSDVQSKQKNSEDEDIIQCEKSDENARNFNQQSKIAVHEQADVHIEPSTRDGHSDNHILKSQIQLRASKRCLSRSINSSDEDNNKKKCKKLTGCTDQSSIQEQESSIREFPSLLTTSIKSCFVDLSSVKLPKKLIEQQNVKADVGEEDECAASTVMEGDNVVNEDVEPANNFSRTSRHGAANLSVRRNRCRKSSNANTSEEEILDDGDLTDLVMSGNNAGTILSSLRTSNRSKAHSPLRRSTRSQLSVEPVDSDIDTYSAHQEPEISSVWGSCMHVNTIKEHGGDLFLGCDDGRTLRMKSQGDLLDHVYSGHDGPVNSIEFYSDYLITGSSDSTIILHCLSGHKNVVAAVPVMEPVQTLFVRWQLLFIGSKNGKVSKFSCHRKCIMDKQIVVGAVNDPVLAINATKEGSRRILIVSAKNQPLTIRDSGSGLLLRSVNVNDIFYSLAFYGSSSSVYCGSRNNSVMVFDFITGEKIDSLNLGKNVIKLIMKWDIIFTACYDGSVHIYNLMTNKLIIKFQIKGLIIDLELWNNKIILSTNDGPVVFKFPPELKKYLKEKSLSILKI